MKNKEVQESLRQVGIRLIEEPPLLSPEPMSSPEAAVRVLGEWLSEMDRELFCVVNLNSNLTPINMNVVSMGALNVAYVHPRDAMKSAILSNAAYMMLIHNHPSGSMTPSKEDIKITDQIQSAASLMGIPVLDHIIVGRHQEFFSIRENNVFSYQNDMQYTSDISKLRWTQQSSVAESTSYGGQNSDVTELKMDTIMNSLEKGVHEIFTSEKYHIYLNTMSKFHNYSFNNTLLIAMQRPDATLVAGYQTWKKKFNRQVQRGEKGIKIIAPAPIKEKRRVEKVDEETQEIVIGDDGQPETEIVERMTPRFRVTTVFDVSQTEGEPLPTLGTTELEGNVVIYEDFMKGLEELSPVPFRFEDIGNGAKGYYSEKYIAIQRDMSNAQTMKTAVHETAHTILHDRDIMQENGVSKDRTTKEVEAESVAYVVCSHFGLDTSEYSFSYIAGWSSNKEMSELRNSMDTIRVTSSKLIEDITEKLIELRKEKAMEEEEIMESVSEKERDETEQEDRTNENSFFERTDDSYAIYQYDNTDGNWGYKFMGLSIISNMGLSVDGKDYRMIFMEQLHEHDSLDELYHRFNAERPEGFDGHSLSVSDVVIMKRNGEMKAYYVDDVGFSELPEFTKQREQIIDRSNDSPVYAGTLEQAVRQKDADAYLDSRKLNIDCKKAIEEAIQENYDGIRLKDDAAKDVVRRFGEERMNFVMANTIRESFLEGRFSKQNKEWAEHINIPENISHGRNLSLNNQRAGRGLMTPGEVKRMDRKKCLIFMEGQYPIMDWKNLPFDTAVWKESKRLAGNTGYKHPVRVVYNPKTMTYRTIRNKQDFQVLDKKDVEFYKEAEKTDRSIKVCEINEEDFLYLNFDTNPTPTEEELIQMFEQSKKDTGLQEKAIEMEEQSTQDNISVVPNFGTEGVVEEKQEDEWDLSGTINQCIQRYAERLTEDQLNEILLGLENGLTEEEVKSYFTFPVEKMNQYRRAYQFMQ